MGVWLRGVLGQAAQERVKDVGGGQRLCALLQLLLPSGVL